MIQNLEKISKIEYTVLLVLSGLFCIFLGKYHILHIDKVSIVKSPETDYLFISVGVFILLLSVCVQIFLIYAKIKTSDLKNQKEIIKIKKAEADKNITNAVEAIKGRRFANLIYIYAEDTRSIAMGYHEKHEVFLPPGGRLHVYEMPHESIIKYVRAQIGLQLSYSDIVSIAPIDIDSHIVTGGDRQRIGDTDICPSPIWVQLEKHTQRSDDKTNEEVTEHFDFVYLCKLAKEVAPEGGTRKGADWFTLDEVKGMLPNKDGKRTFPDVYEGFKIIQSYIDNNLSRETNDQ